MAATAMTPDLCAWEVMETVPLVKPCIRVEMPQQGKPMLSVSPFRALVFLNLSLGAPLCEMADYVGVTRPTASALVDRLVRYGLVNRVHYPRQRRHIMLTLTPKVHNCSSRRVKSHDRGWRACSQTCHWDRCERSGRAWCCWGAYSRKPPLRGHSKAANGMATGGNALRTMACWLQIIRPGIQTQAHRQTGSVVYYVFAGQGSRVIAGQRFDWRRGNFFAVPPWTWHEHANAGDEPAILFSIQDIPVFEALGLYREEAYADNGGHQLVPSALEGWRPREEGDP